MLRENPFRGVAGQPAPEPEYPDQQQDSKEHFPSGDVRGQVVAHQLVNDSPDDRPIKVPRPADQDREDHIRVPEGRDNRGSDKPVKNREEGPGESSQRAAQDEGQPLKIENVITQELHPVLVFLDRTHRNPVGRKGKHFEQNKHQEQACQEEPECEKFIGEIDKAQGSGRRVETILPFGVSLEAGSDQPEADLVKRQIDQGKRGAVRLQDDKPQNHR